jgi:hypothetical protein
MADDNIQTAKVLFKKNGDLVTDDEGDKIKVAHYDRKSGDLEFETREFSVKYKRQVLSAIGTVDNGAHDSGLKVNDIRIKGQADDKPAGKIPPAPKKDSTLGDTTPAYVTWLCKWYPKKAEILYGIYVDENGEWVRKSVRRRTSEMIDDRDGAYGIENDNEGKGLQVGPKKWQKGPVDVRHYQDEFDDQIIARRPTPWKNGATVLFEPKEVMGGWDYEDESSLVQNSVGDERDEVA